LKRLPDSTQALVIRTDFSEPAAWDAVRSAIRAPVHDSAGTFEAYVEFVNDEEYTGLASEQLLSIVPSGLHASFIFLVDHVTLSHPENPILVVDLYDQPGRTFRVIPSEMWAVENNLSIANLDFDEFAGAVDQDGIFRGFPQEM
jgi:hypothetical protein